MAELTSSKNQSVRHRTVIIFQDRPVSASGISWPEDPAKRRLNIHFQDWETERERDYKLKLSDDELTTILMDMVQSNRYNEVFKKAGLVRVAGAS